MKSISVESDWPPRCHHISRVRILEADITSLTRTGDIIWRTVAEKPGGTDKVVEDLQGLSFQDVVDSAALEYHFNH